MAATTSLSPFSLELLAEGQLAYAAGCRAIARSVEDGDYEEEDYYHSQADSCERYATQLLDEAYARYTEMEERFSRSPRNRR